MNIFTNLRSALAGMPAVVALVTDGGKVPARIWNTWPRTYPTPCIVMDVDSEEETPHLGGQGELVIATVVLTCRSDSESQAHALQEAVRSGLAHYAGTDFDVVIDSTVRSQTPKSDGSTDHWYDNILDTTMFWTEAA